MQLVGDENMTKRNIPEGSRVPGSKLRSIGWPWKTQVGLSYFAYGDTVRGKNKPRAPYQGFPQDLGSGMKYNWKTGSGSFFVPVKDKRRR